MTSEQIRRKTQALHAKTRRGLLGSIITPLAVAGLSGWIIAQIPSGPALRAVFAFAVAWSLAGLYFVSRGLWSAGLPGDDAFRTGIESYRREVKRQRSLSGRFLWWTFAPVVLSLATVILVLLSFAIAKGMPLSVLPFPVAVIVWVASVFVIRVRDRRELQREIDDLNDIERSNKG